ncbi:MAG: PspA/IM30 family protein [Pseudonocardiaceae bacterium]
MGIVRRLALIFRAKTNKVLDRAEDPREVLDYSYERQVEMLAKVRRGLADVATSRRPRSRHSVRARRRSRPPTPPRRRRARLVRRSPVSPRRWAM